MKSLKLTALLTTIAISTTMILPAFATESTSNTVAPGSTTTTVPTNVTEHKELTYDDMYYTAFTIPREIFGHRAGALIRVDNIITGYPDGTFRPYSTISKAEAAVIIANSMDYVHENIMRPFPIPKPVMTYRDVNESHPNYAAIKECYEAGVFKDSPDSLFKPDKMLTQAEAVTILANRLEETTIIVGPYAHSGKEVKQQIPNHWARYNYALLADIKIFREPEIKLAPDQYISRIDFVCMLENLFWYELPQLEKFTPEQEADLAMKFKEYPGCEPYYISTLSSPIQYTTKFSDISDLKDYQKYALTRCVEK